MNAHRYPVRALCWAARKAGNEIGKVGEESDEQNLRCPEKSVETLEIRLRRVFLTFAIDSLSILQSKTCLQRYAVAMSTVCLIMLLFPVVRNQV